ncbi:hypothetical protein A6E15_09110 [Natrinema saccharevitans]|uniref:Cytochrome C biogenesis protein n=1 Tax=Natrinema saccharevitans TaxID=301967 RepID=A0A1S8AX09_9EURY|nr:hypothetical protein A6E15_09110 [Natrinema saccharevitans]
MTAEHSRRRFADLLTATVIAAYVLVALGTAVSTTDSAVACSAWPTCSTDPIVGSATGTTYLYWGHRVAALVAGCLVLASGLAARRVAVGRRVTGLGCALVLFPVQVLLGATIAVGGPSVAGVTRPTRSNRRSTPSGVGDVTSGERHGTVAFALGAGIAILFSPCAHALLPGYVGYYVVATGDETAPPLSGTLARGFAAAGAVGILRALRDGDGETLRRYRRSVASVSEA